MPEPTAELTALLEQIETYPDPRRASAEWKQAFKLLQATDLDKRRTQHVVGMRDVAGLKDLISQLAAPEAPATEAPDEEICKKALKAFKKRAKLTRLDDESQLGHGPLSKGADKSLSAITPPMEFPDEVWQHLVHQGKLRYLGNGLYDVPKD